MENLRTCFPVTFSEVQYHSLSRVILALVVTVIGLATMGCAGAPGAVVPTGAVRATWADVESWAAARPAAPPVIHRFRWLYRDREQSLGGRGSARIAAGDSLRLDMAGPLGSGRGAAFVIGDSSVWAEPEEDVRKLVPNFPLLWAMLGVAHLPDHTSEVLRYADAKVTAWRLVHGADTVDFARTEGSPVRFTAEVRSAGSRVGRVVTIFQPDGSLKSSRLDIPGARARLDLTFASSNRTSAFAPDTWLRPEP